MGNVVLVRLATPAALRLTVPSTVLPVAKVTVPVGRVEARLEAMVAVSVALVPGGTAVAEEMLDVSVVVVVTNATDSLSAPAVLLAKLLSPL